MPHNYKRPSVAVDVVIYTIFNGTLHVLTIKRSIPPFEGMWSLVGGYVDVDQDEDLESTAKRKLFEKTGVKTSYLEQLMTFGNKKRDPRGWTVSAVYFALLRSQNIHLTAGSGASEIEWTPLHPGGIKKKLAFDHDEILQTATERLRQKGLYTSLPFYLLEKEFTLSEAQLVFEKVLGKSIEAKSFRRRFLATNLLRDTGKSKICGKRPAKLYSLNPKAEPHFFLRNFEGPDPEMSGL
jgi:8-oxo-dGTP diphosphatase